MAEGIFISEQSVLREQRYAELLPQVQALIAGEKDLIANMANMAAALREALGFFWVGFYLVKNNELVLGPFQGPVACTRIAFGKGVCGTSWKEKHVIIVDDVDQFPGHIACSSFSRSEIVVPLLRDGEVVAVLDVDSDQLSDFNHTDERFLTEMVKMLEQSL
jgi:L-methionine (R)-S-oxide reductase